MEMKKFAEANKGTANKATVEPAKPTAAEIVIKAISPFKSGSKTMAYVAYRIDTPGIQGYGATPTEARISLLHMEAGPKPK